MRYATIVRSAFLAVLVTLAGFAGGGVVFGATAGQGAPARSTQQYEQQLAREVRHELVMIPRLSVFDHLEYSIDNDTVTLSGYVRNDTIKKDAEGAVKGIEGVKTIRNNIEVLPASNMDDQLRLAVYRAIYGDTVLHRYGTGALQSIHIIVKNGNVILAGQVDSEADKNLAQVRANGVPGIFSVKNELKVEAEG